MKRLHLDWDIHLQIVKMAKNPYFTQIMTQFYEKIFFKLRVVYLTPYVESFKEGHERLWRAIKEKNCPVG